MTDGEENHRPSPEQGGAALIEGVHFYREGPFMVLTARAHLERGSCCGNGCRHCLYRGERSKPANPSDR